MKRLTLWLLSLLMFNIDAVAVNNKGDNVDDNKSERPSRLEVGYGSDEMFTETLEYMPTVTIREHIKFVGDLRLRSQNVVSNDPSKPHNEHLFRYRARIGLTAAINDEVKLEFMLASGDGDPVSTNQSMGDSFVGKNLVLDVADIYYEYGYHNFVRAGKLKLPFYRTHKNQMIWDNDLRPEGAFVKHKLFENTDVTAGAFMMRNAKETNSSSAIGLYTLQVVEYISNFRFGGSLFIYDSLKGESSSVAYNHDRYNKKNLSKGNSVDANGSYINDYHLAELFVQYDISEELSIGVDGVYNFGADQENRAYNLSVMYGDLKVNGDFKLGYYYRYTEKDAVLGMFSDSDFGGGRTNAKGHQLMGGYQIVENTQLAFTYINGKVDRDFGEEDYQRLHLDFKIKF